MQCKYCKYIIIYIQCQCDQNIKLAAKGGITPALHNIGNCYAYGKGTKQSDYNAILFYEAAVEAGDPSAMFTLVSNSCSL